MWNSLVTTQQIPWWGVLCPWVFLPPEQPDPATLAVAHPPLEPAELLVALPPAGATPMNPPIVITAATIAMVWQYPEEVRSSITHYISVATLNALPAESLNALIQQNLLTDRQIQGLAHNALERISDDAFVHLLSQDTLSELQYSSAYINHDRALAVVQARFEHALGPHPDYGYVYPLMWTLGSIDSQTMVQLFTSRDSQGTYFLTRFFLKTENKHRYFQSEHSDLSQNHQYASAFDYWRANFLFYDQNGVTFANQLPLETFQQFTNLVLFSTDTGLFSLEKLDDAHFNVIRDDILIKLIHLADINPVNSVTEQWPSHDFVHTVRDLLELSRGRPAVLYDAYRQLNNQDRKILFIQITHFNPDWTPANSGSQPGSSNDPPPPNAGDGRPGSCNDPAPDQGGANDANGDLRRLQTYIPSGGRDIRPTPEPGVNYFGQDIHVTPQDVQNGNNRIQVLDVVHNQLTSGTAHQWYKIALLQNTIYHFKMVREGDSHLDASLTLRDASGAVIAVDKGLGGGHTQFISLNGGRNSLITFIAPTSGDYILDAGSGGYQAAGAYQLSSMLIERKTLEVGSSVQDLIEVKQDRDWYQVHLNKGEYYHFELDNADPGTNKDFSPLLCLRDAQGNSLLLCEDSQLRHITNHAEFKYVAKETGDYFLDVGSAHSSSTGRYLLTAYRENDIGSSVKTRAEIKVGETLQGTLENGHNHDWYKLNLQEGTNYKFSLKRLNNAEILDPWLNLRDIHGNILKSDDDSGGNLDAFLQYKSTKTGTYFLDAGSYRDKTLGQFSLVVMAG